MENRASLMVRMLLGMVEIVLYMESWWRVWAFPAAPPPAVPEPPRPPDNAGPPKERRARARQQDPPAPPPVEPRPKPKDDGAEYAPVPVPAAPEAPPGDSPLVIDHLCGADSRPAQVGVLGKISAEPRFIGINLDAPFGMGFFGVPNSGKSYVLAAIIEMLLMPIAALNNLKAAFCVLVLHYHPSADYEPEMLASVHPNRNPREVGLLSAYGAAARGLVDVLVLTLEEEVLRMREQHPHCQVHSIKFSLAELGMRGLRILLGLTDDKASPLYIKEVGAMLRKLRRRGERIVWQDLLDEIAAHPFTADVLARLGRRLQLAEPYIDDGRTLRSYIRPGRLIEVDIRDEWLSQDEALLLFALLTEVLVLKRARGAAAKGECPLLLVYDEAHKFAKSKLIRQQMSTVFRERRHLNTSAMLASQDPPSVPAELLGLMDGVGLFCCQSANWLKLLAKHIAAFGKLRPEDTARLCRGEMWFWAKEWVKLTELVGATDDDPPLTANNLVRLVTRPRVSQHGGASLLAVPPDQRDKRDAGPQLVDQAGSWVAGVADTVQLIDDLITAYAPPPPPVPGAGGSAGGLGPVLAVIDDFLAQGAEEFPPLRR